MERMLAALRIGGSMLQWEPLFTSNIRLQGSGGPKYWYLRRRAEHVTDWYLNFASQTEVLPARKCSCQHVVRDQHAALRASTTVVLVRNYVCWYLGLC